MYDYQSDGQIYSLFKTVWQWTPEYLFKIWTKSLGLGYNFVYPHKKCAGRNYFRNWKKNIRVKFSVILSFKLLNWKGFHSETYQKICPITSCSSIQVMRTKPTLYKKTPSLLFKIKKIMFGPNLSVFTDVWSTKK